MPSIGLLFLKFFHFPPYLLPHDNFFKLNAHLSIEFHPWLSFVLSGNERDKNCMQQLILHHFHQNFYKIILREEGFILTYSFRGISLLLWGEKKSTVVNIMVSRQFSAMGHIKTTRSRWPLNIPLPTSVTSFLLQPHLLPLMPPNNISCYESTKVLVHSLGQNLCDLNSLEMTSNSTGVFCSSLRQFSV